MLSDIWAQLGHAFRACKTLLSAVELGLFTELAKKPPEMKPGEPNRPPERPAEPKKP